MKFRVHHAVTQNENRMYSEYSREMIVGEWKACHTDQHRDCTWLMQMVDPFLAKWTEMLSCPESEKDLSFISLMKLLSGSEIDPYEGIHCYTQWCEQNINMHSDLQCLFLERLRRMKFLSDGVDSYYQEYTILTDFKLYLRNRIVAVTLHEMRRHRAESEFVSSQEKIALPVTPDYFVLEHYSETAWEAYLMYCRLNRISLETMVRLTGIYFTRLIREGDKVWRELNESLQMIPISRTSRRWSRPS